MCFTEFTNNDMGSRDIIRWANLLGKEDLCVACDCLSICSWE